MAQDGRRDLHAAFRDPGQAVPATLTGFLEDADRLPGTQAIHRAMRRKLAPWPGATLLDAGCGVGLETIRLADDHAEVQVTGLDQNADLLGAARRRAGDGRANLTWIHADLADPALPAGAFDLIRTERVLMYLPGARFGEGIGALLRLLRPGGRLALFELDYGGTILSPGPDQDLTRELTAAFETSLPQPWAGRRLPEALAERGAVEITADPFAFAVTATVWEAIVLKTLRLAAADARLTRAAVDQLEAQASAAAGTPFLAAICGLLTTARKPG